MSNTGSRIRRTLLVVLPILGIAIGIALIVSGTQIEEIAADAEFYTGPRGIGNLTHLGEVTFGGDYQTEIYKATAFTGNVLKAIFDLVGFALPAAFKLGGSLVILSSAGTSLDQAATQSRSTDTDTPTTASEDTQPPQGNESDESQQ